MSHPPEPWDLRGQLYLTMWRLPLADLPALPPGLAPVRLGSHALVSTAWVVYEPGGVLAYRELLVAVPVWHDTRLRTSITDIWVDSAPSLHGGRKLWGIPKELARFDVAGPRFAASTPDGAVIARGTVIPRTGLPGRWPARYTIVQDGSIQDGGSQVGGVQSVGVHDVGAQDGGVQDPAGELVVTPVRSSAALRLTHTEWEFAPDGPLAWLAGGRPLLSASLRDFRLRFGR